MQLPIRLALALLLVVAGTIAYGQEVDHQPTSATDHKVRIEKTRRMNKEARATERHGKSLGKRKEAGGSGSSKEAKVYKRHRHFADRDIKYRSRSKMTRKENLGVGTE
jgi:hypothetical protein